MKEKMENEVSFLELPHICLSGYIIYSLICQSSEGMA